MAMRQNGLAKLTEEMGEALQVAGKLIQYPDHQPNNEPIRLIHPDGTYLRGELEDELADVIAATQFVMNKLGLDSENVRIRTEYKLALFEKWDQEP